MNVITGQVHGVRQEGVDPPHAGTTTVGVADSLKLVNERPGSSPYYVPSKSKRSLTTQTIDHY